MNHLRNEIRSKGFAIWENAIPISLCNELLDCLPNVEQRKGGIRNLLSVERITRFVRSNEISSIVKSVIGPHANAVKGILFDKTPISNWAVAWHQDRTIAVQERVNKDGYSCWTLKNGSIIHVEPPLSVMESVLTVRVHLDDCDVSNGSLRVIPGTHVLGKLNSQEIRHLVATSKSVSIPAAKGSFIIMRPLLLHSSSASKHVTNRRVLHIEFANEELIAPLRWHKSISLC
jgi:ectoine hydroxylase-related dioxygenase (phytanoyl-CoA dioxygenase family)